jgi:hypothetical protein
MFSSKSKLQITSGKKAKVVKLGASTSSKSKPFAPKAARKDYSKSAPKADAFGEPSFGDTALTGES